MDSLESRSEKRHTGRDAAGSGCGNLIVNADDWGCDRQTTDCALDCVLCGTVSSVSAMMFMEDSERAAAIAREHGIDAGLHLNFTTSFSAPGIPARLCGHQQCLALYLLRHRFSQVVFHPGLIRSFEYVVAAQRDEFSRLYGREPDRLDGHHHMHLCANVLCGRLLPAKAIVRRSFSFLPREKSFANRLYRNLVDRALMHNHSSTDLFFSLSPLDPPSRLRRIISLSNKFTVEVETHPINPDEYRFLTGGELLRMIKDLPIATRFSIPE
jgi:hypothetical protein